MPCDPPPCVSTCNNNNLTVPDYINKEINYLTINIGVPIYTENNTFIGYTGLYSTRPTYNSSGSREICIDPEGKDHMGFLRGVILFKYNGSHGHGYTIKNFTIN